MTSIKINHDTLNKLTHESTEIRLRTLEQLSSKINRAMALNESIEFNPSDLCKQLIRWFRFVPLQQPLKVLNLLKSIIEYPKYGSKAINNLGSDRLVKELQKIQAFFESHSAEFAIISKLKEFLNNIPNVKEIPDISENLHDLTQRVSNMKIQEVEPEYSGEDYETPWSSPSPSDYTSMKLLSDILRNKFASNVEIENALCHIQLTMEDYPVEYLLQAPYIFQNILQIYDERKSSKIKNISIDFVAAAVLKFLYVLEKRLKMLRKSMSFKNAYGVKSLLQKSGQSPCQLKVEKALTELFEASIFHLESHVGVSPIIWEVIFMALKLLENIKRSVNILCLYKIASVVNNINVKIAKSEHPVKLRLYQMLFIFLLQDVVERNICPRPAKILDILEPILRDYSLKSFFMKRHQLIETFVLKADKSVREKYHLIKLYEESFEKSIKMLTMKSNRSCGDIIKEGNNVFIVLDMLRSKELIDVLFGGVIQCIPLYPRNTEMRAQAIDLLLKLLNLTFMPLKIHVYGKLTDAFKRHIGCLMTGEGYALDCSNANLLKAHIIGVPLNTEILMQFVHDSFESTSDQIRRNACKMLELFLQSQTLFGNHWTSLLPIVVPLLPLLNCCTFSNKIMDLMLKIFHPDLRQLPYVCVLQGNISFLFHSNADRRSESLNRLIYTLNSLKGAENYVPNLLETSDTIADDICLQNTPREYRNIFSDRMPVRCDVITNLNNLLHLLESPDIEPLIRKTTLMQINVLCSNWNITAELCSIGAYYLILQALENALQKFSDSDYADTAVPAISILNKIMLYDSSVRCELAETPNIYVLLLRALMMFHHVIQVRQDATMCLFQLVFSSQLITTENCIEGPLILDNITVPVDISFRSALSNKIQQDPEKMSRIFASKLEETQYCRMVVASSYFGDLANFTQKSLTDLSQLDIRDDFKLSIDDFHLIRATQPTITLNRFLNAALNSTDHKSFINACRIIQQLMIMARLKDTFSINEEVCVNMNNILGKYLRMPPGSNNDFSLYEALLDLAYICLKVPLVLVALEIFKFLHKDRRYALITMLTQDEEIPLKVFNKITTLLRLLIDDHRHIFETKFNASECSSFYNYLFTLFIERCLQLFEIRDLQRVRCLLSLMVALSSCQLNTPDVLLFSYCRRFAQLSSALKSFTQTGSQWHRDCLLVILQLSVQMQNSTENFRLTASFVKYFSGLCGHNDVEVRLLAWSILNITAKTKAISTSVTEGKGSGISGIEMLINELPYLPEGFIASCLATLLNPEEAICVRHMAGQLLAVVIRTHGEVQKIEKLFEQFYFTRSATEALTSSVCILEMEMPIDMDVSNINVSTCDLISCYSLNCIALSQRSPAFLSELCTKSFMFRLYEILKKPPPLSKHIGYMNMIGHICRLYTLCYSNNFIFLQRTICRDIVWLESFCKILFGIVAPSNETYITLTMLQLFLILCKDPIALEQLLIKLPDYSMDIVKLFQDALTVRKLKTSLQSCSLSVLSFLLYKSQPEVDADLSIHILTLFESQSVPIKTIRCNEMFKSDNMENKHSNKTENQPNFTKEKASVDKTEASKSSISEHLCIFLIQLFTHLYPIKLVKFSTPPNLSQQRVTETLGLLLKQLPGAQETAQNLKFQEKVIQMFKTFFDEYATTSSITYVKRHGEHKKLAVIRNLELLQKMLLSWHSSPAMIITDNTLAMEYSKIVTQIWHWLAHSKSLKLTVLQVCSFLSESSLVVCKQFSTSNVLQLVAKMMTDDTLKIKAHSTDCNTHISAGLRLLMNCCSCSEGRNALNKIHVLNVFDSLYPLNPKASQLKMDIFCAWLEFWELFSRYDEGAQSRNLNALCSVVNKSPTGCQERLISLRILRNIAFLNSNRSTLITSTDFIYTVNEIVSQPITDSVEEQFIVCVALWKLISGGIKFVSMIRGTKLSKSLRLLNENLTCTEDENRKTVKYSDDLLNVLNIIFKIFKS